MTCQWNQDFWQGKRVWLSGHTGFKGSWLALWLIRWGAIVEGYSLNPEKNGPQNYSFFESLAISNDLYQDIRADILNLECLTACFNSFQPEVVFHLAAQPLVQKSYSYPSETWMTNVIGTCNVLEALRKLEKKCVAVIITTDKVYENCEWDHSYREIDPLGGYDPYSSSKAAAELAVSSWRSSYFNSREEKTSLITLASARAGNVIGGGDWAENRIVPDAIRALMNQKPIPIRSPLSTRPWQHVLEPLGGYLLLAEKLYSNPTLASAFNFGPVLTSNRSVHDLVEGILSKWPGSWCDQSEGNFAHEAGRLNLTIDKAFHQLSWMPRWDFEQTITETVNWYRSFYKGEESRKLCMDQIERYTKGK